MISHQQALILVGMLTDTIQVMQQQNEALATEVQRLNELLSQKETHTKEEEN